MTWDWPTPSDSSDSSQHWTTHWIHPPPKANQAILSIRDIWLSRSISTCLGSRATFSTAPQWWTAWWDATVSSHSRRTWIRHSDRFRFLLGCFAGTRTSSPRCTRRRSRTSKMNERQCRNRKSCIALRQTACPSRRCSVLRGSICQGRGVFNGVLSEAEACSGSWLGISALEI